MLQTKLFSLRLLSPLQYSIIMVTEPTSYNLLSSLHSIYNNQMQLSREKPPRRSNSKDQYNSSSLLEISPNKRNDSALSIIKEVLRWLVDKINEIEQIITTNSQRSSRKNIITITEKPAEKSSKLSNSKMQQTSFTSIIDTNLKIQSLLDSLEDKKPSELKLPSSPIHQIFDQIDVKQLVARQTSFLKSQIQELRDKFKFMQENLENTFSSYEQELTSLIIALKDSVYNTSQIR